jgi:hypothetical protein
LTLSGAQTLDTILVILNALTWAATIGLWLVMLAQVTGRGRRRSLLPASV